ncbi:hypothetical protein FNV43_RR03384 [Rhamnella rubrinervis]|uniref:Kinesin motor domain-containing protein n=1 Tax=Rhamnella rubrinervis TaxID=2594499 RepID=A0A8K0HIB2_9ROSA|nr:hypothetical protein FNV43_RR03384 [Rhamnella rubrinervis]
MASLCGAWAMTHTPVKANPNSIPKVKVIVRVRPFLPHEITVKDEDQTPFISALQQERQSADEVSVYLQDKETRPEISFCRSECDPLD